MHADTLTYSFPVYTQLSPYRTAHYDTHHRHPKVTLHNPITRPAPGTGIKVHFKDSKGTLLKTVEANEGDSILDLAHEYDVDLEGMFVHSSSFLVFFIPVQNTRLIDDLSRNNRFID